jgi:hypothetical protein
MRQNIDILGVARKRNLAGKSRSAKHMSKFAALSPAMVTEGK